MTTIDTMRTQEGSQSWHAWLESRVTDAPLVAREPDLPRKADGVDAARSRRLFPSGSTRARALGLAQRVEGECSPRKSA